MSNNSQNVETSKPLSPWRQQQPLTSIQNISDRKTHALHPPLPCLAPNWTPNPSPDISVTSEVDASEENPEYVLQTEINAHFKSISSIKFSPCGVYLATASADKLIKIWDLDQSTTYPIKRIAVHNTGINDLAWCGCSRFIASASDDKTVRITNVKEENRVTILRGHTNYVLTCSYNRSSTMLASGSYDGTARTWDVKTGACLRVLQHMDAVSCVAFSYKGDTLATTCYDRRIRIWDCESGAPIDGFAEEYPIVFVKYTPNGRYLLTASLDDTLRLYSIVLRKQVKVYKGHISRQDAIFADLSVVGKHHLVCGSEDGKVYVWDIQSRKVLQVLGRHATSVIAVSCNPTRKLLATASLEPDHKLRIWKSVT
ncbi:unnamed protein product [Caenorhabditis sp. 36 PRJEB53466]|nr:unnamed protein product [Caenorhabditis sp. 36 PRJEB53466]